MTVRGVPLSRTAETGRPFLLELPSGETQRIYVQAVPFDSAPVLRIDGVEYPVAPPLRLWEKVTVLLPLASALVIGALRSHNGLVPGALGSLAAAVILRSGRSGVFRVIAAISLALASSLVAASWNVPTSRAGIGRAAKARSSPVRDALRKLPAPPSVTSLSRPVTAGTEQRLTPAMMFELRDLLIAGQHDSLEILFSRWSEEAEHDVRNETRLYDAFDAFEAIGPDFEGALDFWIEKKPESWNARLARANYLVRTAYRQRGSKSVRQTPRSNFKAMHRTLQSALVDLGAALRLNPRALEAYWVAMEAATALGDSSGTLLALDRALQVSPLSFFSRARALLALQPRWGGSYRIMERVASVPDSLRAAYPELNLLPGFIPLDKGNAAWLAKDTVLALRFLDDAMEVGPTYWSCLARGRLLLRLDRKEQALRDLDCAVTLRPTSPEARFYRSRVFYDIAFRNYPRKWAELFGQAEAEGDLAFRLDSLDPGIRKHRAFLAEQRRGVRVPLR